MAIIHVRQWHTTILQKQKVLELLHDTHPGMERMKRLARSYVWWPGLDTEIEGKVKSCHACQSSRNKPEVVPLNPLEWPSKPWTRIHLDYTGPFMNSMFLIIADAHTKWLDIHVTSSSTAPITTENYKEPFQQWVFRRLWLLTMGQPLHVMSLQSL